MPLQPFLLIDLLYSLRPSLRMCSMKVLLFSLPLSASISPMSSGSIVTPKYCLILISMKINYIDIDKPY
jgi:hypothetical protein